MGRGQRFAAGSGPAISIVLALASNCGSMHRAYRSSAAGMDGKGAIMDGTRASRDDYGRYGKEEAYFVVNNSAAAQMYLTGYLLG